LSQGTQAAIPEGLQRDQIVLEPQDQPILYRNFLDGLSARGIAVGYPGGLNIAWDAQSMNLAKLWQGQFIDASMHWRDRGVGRQKPLGDLVLNYESRPAVAWLNDPAEAWPESNAVTKNYKFLGYKTDKSGHPTFRYKLSNANPGTEANPGAEANLGADAIARAEAIVGDRAELSVGPKDAPGLKRTLNFQVPKSATNAKLYVRLAEGAQIVLDGKNTWTVDDKYQITVPEAVASNAIVRDSANKKELLLPVLLPTANATSNSPANAELEYYLRW
jgi:hypothetical protein